MKESAVGLLLLALAACGGAAAAQDSDSAVAVYGFSLDETVAVRLDVSRLERTFDVWNTTAATIDFGEIHGITGAVTGYDMYVSADAHVTHGALERPTPPRALELRLDEGAFGGTAPTWVNREALGFKAAVAPPERTLLFSGGNNVADNTTFVVVARVNLKALLELDLRAGDTVSFDVVFTIVER